MEYTNRNNLPEPFVSFAKADPYSRGKADISVTQLIDSPRIRIMQHHHRDSLVSDVSDSIWALFGTAVHQVLESHSGADGVIVEERLFSEINGWTVSGAVDYQKIERGTVSVVDYKVTSVWSVIFGKESWEHQLNTYATLIEKEKGLKVKSLQICAILRDWNRKDAQFKPDYPALPVATVDVPLWDAQKRREYVESRVALHQEAQIGYDLEKSFPLCSAEDMWRRKDSWAVIPKGRKRALRVFDNESDAVQFHQENGKDTFIEHRKGESTRCSGNFCGVSEFCNQYKESLGEETI